MIANIVVNPKLYRYQALHEMGQSYWALTDPYPLNLNYHFWPNLGSHNMDFWPNAQELVCQQFSSEIYTKFYIRQYIQTFWPKKHK